jgi:hypothetical protein
MVDLNALAAPFGPTVPSWRVGSKASDSKTGRALAFIDARDVMERLDEVCGPGGWQCRYSHANANAVCDIGIKVGDEWIWKANGAGDTEVDQEKGAFSDAFKSAAVCWGVGRYLHGLPKVWAKIRPIGKSFVIDDSEFPRLAEILVKHAKGLWVPDSLPPRHQDDDAVNGHENWVRDQKFLLANLTNHEEVREWKAANDKNIQKLSRDNIPLYGDLKRAVEDAKARTRGVLASGVFKKGGGGGEN